MRASSRGYHRKLNGKGALYLHHPYKKARSRILGTLQILGELSLESAPVPVAGHAGRDVRALGDIGRLGPRNYVPSARGHAHGRRGRDGAVLDIRAAVRRGRGGRVCAGVLLLPGLLVLLVAVGAGARGDGSTRVEVGVLVEGNGVRGVPVAEDVAAAAAVVATDEVVEVALAGRVIADSGLRVGLFRLCETKGSETQGFKGDMLTFQCLRVGSSVTWGKS